MRSSSSFGRGVRAGDLDLDSSCSLEVGPSWLVSTERAAVCEALWEGVSDEWSDAYVVPRRGGIADDGFGTIVAVSVAHDSRGHYVPGKLPPLALRACSALSPCFPISPQTHPQSMRARHRAPRPSRAMLMRRASSSRSLVTRWASQAWSSAWAWASLALVLAGPTLAPAMVELVEGREEREAEAGPVRGATKRDERWASRVDLEALMRRVTLRSR